MKKFLVLITLVLILGLCFANDSITSLKVTENVRLNEKVSVSGQYNDPDTNAYVLCKFIVGADANLTFIDRWSDEYTFSNGSFYAEKIVNEPPYYRGDTYVMNVTCGTASADANFTVGQPVSIAHPVQKTWEYLFEQSNQDAIFYAITFFGIIIITILAGVFFVKIIRGYNAG